VKNRYTAVTAASRHEKTNTTRMNETSILLAMKSTTAQQYSSITAALLININGENISSLKLLQSNLICNGSWQNLSWPWKYSRSSAMLLFDIKHVTNRHILQYITTCLACTTHLKQSFSVVKMACTVSICQPTVANICYIFWSPGFWMGY